MISEQTTHNKKLISIIVPIFNEEGNLPEFHETLLHTITPLFGSYNFEVIFIDDGSKDQSWNLIANFAQNPLINGLKFSRNFGQQTALMAGYHHAKGHAVISMDADLQDPPELIPKIIEQWELGSPVVYARRIGRADQWLKKVTAAAFYAVFYRITPLSIPQAVAHYRLLDRKVVLVLQELKEQTSFLRGLVAWCGFKYTFVDFYRPARIHGESSYSWRKLFQLAFCGIISFSNILVKIPAFVGIGIFLLATLLLHYHVIDGAHTFLAYVLGLQSFFIWILAEYVSRMLDQVRNRPLYVVETNTKIDISSQVTNYPTPIKDPQSRKETTI